MARLPSAEELRRRLNYDPESGQFYWAAGSLRAGQKAGNNTNPDGYVRIGIGSSGVFLAHRLAWVMVHGREPKHHIDHINGNKADNRIANLRDVPRSMNMQNQRRASRNSKSGLLGVWPTSNGRWASAVRVGSKLHHVGTFESAEEAHARYLVAKRQHHAGCTL